MPEDIRAVHVWLIVMKAFHAIARYGSRSYRESGLGESDFRVLEALLHKGPLPVNIIGPKVFLTAGSISTAVDRLYERELVSRTEQGTDRRVRLVDLTLKGRRLIEQIFNAHSQDMEKLAETLSASERAQLIKTLKKLGHRAAEYAANQGGHSSAEPVEQRESLRKAARKAWRRSEDRRRKRR